MPRSVPTVRQRRLGRDLRQLREARDLSSDRAAAQLGWSQSKISRIETARIGVTPPDVSRMLDLYGVSSHQRAALVQLAHEAQQRGWWAEYGDVFTGSYIGLEDEADSIRDFEPQVVPGLLQTEEYARAVIEAVRPGESHAEIDRRVRARMARKVLLSRDDPPTLTAIIAESALRWPIGGRDVMSGQMRALLDAGRRSNVNIRVLHPEAGAHAGLDGPFVILSFSGDDFPDVAYTEGPAGDNYVESADQVRRVTLNWNRIADKALSVEESARILADLAEE